MKEKHEIDLENLIQKVSKYVMKIVNKHHSDTNKNIANYKREVARVVKLFQHLEHKYINAVGEFNEKQESLPRKLQEIKDVTISHATGVQNVYNKFIAIENRQMKIEELLYSIQKDLNESRRETHTPTS